MLTFKQHINEQHAKGGFDYEDKVNQHLQKHGAQTKGEKVLVLPLMRLMVLFIQMVKAII